MTLLLPDKPSPRLQKDDEMADATETGSTWLTIVKVALLYVFFILASLVMSVIGLILLPAGLIGYLMRLPFRRRAQATPG